MDHIAYKPGVLAAGHIPRVRRFLQHLVVETSEDSRHSAIGEYCVCVNNKAEPCNQLHDGGVNSNARENGQPHVKSVTLHGLFDTEGDFLFPGRHRPQTQEQQLH
jgi:hypothetical protein